VKAAKDARVQFNDALNAEDLRCLHSKQSTDSGLFCQPYRAFYRENMFSRRRTR
jgi:hypothetical protein